MKKKLFPILLSVLFASVSGTTVAQSKLFNKETFTNKDGETLNYRLLISDYDQSSTYPLVIFLHGSGERGEDNEAQLKWGVKNFATPEVMKNYRPVVIAPQCPSGESWANLSQSDLSLRSEPTKPMKLLMELIDEIVANYAIDKDRIYITGLSMGGYGTYDLIMRRPELFAAAVPVCGAGDPGKAALISSIPIWIFHGAKDDVVDPKHSKDMYSALVKAGAKPGLTIYPEAGHFSWIPAYNDPMLMPWLFDKKK